VESPAADCLQPPLLRRCGLRQRLRRSVRHPEPWAPAAPSKPWVLLHLEGGTTMRRYVSMWFIVVMVVTGLASAARAQGPPEGQLILGMDFTIVPAFLDPSEMTGATAAIFAYALHDALLKPLPG